MGREQKSALVSTPSKSWEELENITDASSRRLCTVEDKMFNLATSKDVGVAKGPGAATVFTERATPTPKPVRPTSVRTAARPRGCSMRATLTQDVMSPLDAPSNPSRPPVAASPCGMQGTLSAKDGGALSFPAPGAKTLPPVLPPCRKPETAATRQLLASALSLDLGAHLSPSMSGTESVRSLARACKELKPATPHSQSWSSLSLAKATSKQHPNFLPPISGAYIKTSANQRSRS